MTWAAKGFHGRGLCLGIAVWLLIAAAAAWDRRLPATAWCLIVVMVVRLGSTCM